MVAAAAASPCARLARRAAAGVLSGALTGRGLRSARPRPVLTTVG